MNINHFSYDTSSGKMAAHFSTTKESLGVVHTDSIWISLKRHLVLIVETNQMITGEIEVLLNDDTMTIEAPLLSSNDKPFGMHKGVQESRTDVEDGLTAIGLSAIRLKPGYEYTHISSEVIDSNLIKVILEYKALGRQT